MKAYHVTKDCDTFKAILKEGVIKACRLKYVYLFKDRQDAEIYKQLFKCYHVFVVEIELKQIDSQWKPSYAKNGVIKLKQGEVVKLK
jgi:hypothetical protein